MLTGKNAAVLNDATLEAVAGGDIVVHRRPDIIVAGGNPGTNHPPKEIMAADPENSAGYKHIDWK